MDQWEVTSDGCYGWTLFWRYGFMLICPSHWPETVAIDAACEFMDRYKSGRMPNGCEHVGDLMDFCVRAARRQR